MTIHQHVRIECDHCNLWLSALEFKCCEGCDGPQPTFAAQEYDARLYDTLGEATKDAQRKGWVLVTVAWSGTELSALCAKCYKAKVQKEMQK